MSLFALVLFDRSHDCQFHTLVFNLVRRIRLWSDLFRRSSFKVKDIKGCKDSSASFFSPFSAQDVVLQQRPRVLDIVEDRSGKRIFAEFHPRLGTRDPTSALSKNNFRWHPDLISISSSGAETSGYLTSVWCKTSARVSGARLSREFAKCIPTRNGPQLWHDAPAGLSTSGGHPDSTSGSIFSTNLQSLLSTHILATSG